jgi:hypothetical protein
MNGSQQPKDAGAQQAASAIPAAANGSSGVTKKRKKDALKPIITTEGTTTSGYVKHFLVYHYLQSVRSVESRHGAKASHEAKRSSGCSSSIYGAPVVLQLDKKHPNMTWDQPGWLVACCTALEPPNPETRSGGSLDGGVVLNMTYCLARASLSTPSIIDYLHYQ